MTLEDLQKSVEAAVKAMEQAQDIILIQLAYIATLELKIKVLEAKETSL